jgi:ABC-type glycerol-3-phosphate transport system permease component
MKRNKKKMLMTFIKNFLCYVLLIGITIFCVFPIAWIVKTSFETPEYIRSSQIQWIPIKFTWDNYVRVLTDPNAQILRSFGNSLIVSISSTLLSLVMTTMAGYALSRWKFRGKHALNIYLLLVNLVPGTLVLISMFIVLNKIHLVNTHLGLILFYISSGITLATWMLKGYFDSIPVDIEEQAMVDGADRMTVIRKIIMPLASPGIFSTGAYLFLKNWNEYMAATTILQQSNLRTLSVQIINYMGFQRVEWGPIMAYSVIVMIPSTIMFFIAQKNMIAGLTAGFSK